LLKLQQSLLAATIKGSLLLLGAAAVLRSDQGQDQQAQGKKQQKSGHNIILCLIWWESGRYGLPRHRCGAVAPRSSSLAYAP
jgi:hypothetical protein